MHTMGIAAFLVAQTHLIPSYPFFGLTFLYQNVVQIQLDLGTIELGHFD